MHNPLPPFLFAIKSIDTTQGKELGLMKLLDSNLFN